MQIVKNANGRNILLNMVKAIQDNKKYLGDIDGLIGDGDHGMNMNKGFSIYAEQLRDKDTLFSDGLFELGGVLLNKIGGSMGPIYGTLFMDMASEAGDEEDITPELFERMLEAGMEGLYEIVDARPGDKTLVDTLYPALDAIKTAVKDGKSFNEALDSMKEAALLGRDSTKELTAKYGRSARLGERSRGVLDAGAVSCCILLEAMADGMKDAMEG